MIVLNINFLVFLMITALASLLLVPVDCAACGYISQSCCAGNPKCLLPVLVCVSSKCQCPTDMVYVNGQCLNGRFSNRGKAQIHVCKPFLTTCIPVRFADEAK